eukprot:7187156-Alexandrium_andersonii.AAC.1
MPAEARPRSQLAPTGQNGPPPHARNRRERQSHSRMQIRGCGRRHSQPGASGAPALKLRGSDVRRLRAAERG